MRTGTHNQLGGDTKRTNFTSCNLCETELSWKCFVGDKSNMNPLKKFSWLLGLGVILSSCLNDLKSDVKAPDHYQAIIDGPSVIQLQPGDNEISLVGANSVPFSTEPSATNPVAMTWHLNNQDDPIGYGYWLNNFSLPAGNHSITLRMRVKSDDTVLTDSVSIERDGVSGPTEPNDPSRKRIVGYLPNYRNIGAYTRNYDISKFTHLIYAFIDPDRNGAMPPAATDLRQLRDSAHAAGVKVGIALAGGSPPHGVWEHVLRSTTSTSAVAASIANFAQAEQIDLVDVDLEGSLTALANYSLFITELAKNLKPMGKELTAATSYFLADRMSDEAVESLDFINSMSYDLNWGRDAHHSTMEHAIRDLAYWSNRGVAREKIVLGVPFYGWNFPAGASSRTFAQIVGSDPENYHRDYYNGYYYNGADTIAAKTQLANDYGGVMIWEVAQDARPPFSLLDVIYANSSN